MSLESSVKFSSLGKSTIFMRFKKSVGFVITTQGLATQMVFEQ